MTTSEWAVKVTFGDGAQTVDAQRFDNRHNAEGQLETLRALFPPADPPKPDDFAALTIVSREVGPWEDR